jgi:dTDP-4-amino-4,6-dideoxygalactose transaminase
LKKNLNVTSPTLPSLEEFIPYLQDIWKRKWITNNGHYHNQLEEALCDFLGVRHLSLFTNGTLPIITALHALRISGEVITTPYSFVATAHSIWWNGLKPVFVDVDLQTGNIDPSKIEEAITPHTSAIMPVHVYGTPCDISSIEDIANRYGLAVIYDAAHAFNVKEDGQSILNAGNMSTLSFHATKVFNTIEGGALICSDQKTKQRIDHLKNFGFADETSVVAPGINGKLDEVRAAFGLCNLQTIEQSILNRKQIADFYSNNLPLISSISLMIHSKQFTSNYSYYPIFVTSENENKSRDKLYEYLKSKGIFARRYFYPLISAFPMYKGLSSSKPENLINAHKLAATVLCLPIFDTMEIADAKWVVDEIYAFFQ